MSEQKLERIKEMRKEIYAQLFNTTQVSNEVLEVAYDSYTHTAKMLGKPVMSLAEFQMQYQHNPDILK
jgi:hypothetical protein